jgi:signal transduction histidine kinase
VPRIAEQINASTQTLGEMLNALLDISRLDIDGVKPDIQTFPLESRSLAACMTPSIARPMHIACACVFTRPGNICTPTRACSNRMIGNLISNAIRYTPAGGSILVGARRQGDKMRIEIRDSGIGIAREHRTAIFAEFFQVANNARELDGGLGLGLSIVERLAGDWTYQISLDSQIGHGTTFGLLVARGRAEVHTASRQTATGRVHFIGTSEELAACKRLIEDWNYECSKATATLPSICLTIPRSCAM